MLASASVCVSLSRKGPAVGRRPPRRKAARPLLDADQAAPDQRLQRGAGQIAAAQLGQRQLVVAGRQLGQNCLLLFRQRGQPRVGNEHGKALHAPRIAFGGRGLARDPLLAQHGGQKRKRCRSSGAQCGDLDGLTGGQAPAPAAPSPAPRRKSGCAAWRWFLGRCAVAAEKGRIRVILEGNILPGLKPTLFLRYLRHGRKRFLSPLESLRPDFKSPLRGFRPFVGLSQDCASLVLHPANEDLFAGTPALGYSPSAPPGRMPHRRFHPLGWVEGPWRHD
jgi:hypothetical protein